MDVDTLKDPVSTEEESINIPIAEIDPMDGIDLGKTQEIKSYIDKETEDLMMNRKYYEEYNELLLPYFNKLVESRNIKEDPNTENPYRAEIEGYNVLRKFENSQEISSIEESLLTDKLLPDSQHSYLEITKDMKKLCKIIAKSENKRIEELKKGDYYRFYIKNYNDLLLNKPKTKESKILKDALEKGLVKKPKLNKTSEDYRESISRRINQRKHNSGRYFCKETITEEIDSINKDYKDDVLFLSQIEDEEFRKIAIETIIKDVRTKNREMVDKALKKTAYPERTYDVLKKAIESTLNIKPNYPSTWAQLPPIKEAIGRYNEELIKNGKEKSTNKFDSPKEIESQPLFHTTSETSFLKILELGTLDSLGSQIRKTGRAERIHSGNMYKKQVLIENNGQIMVEEEDRNGKDPLTELNEICFTEPGNRIYHDYHLEDSSVTFVLPSTSLKKYSFYIADGLHLLDKQNPNDTPLAIDLDDLIIVTKSTNTRVINAILEKKGKDWARDHLVLNHDNKEGDRIERADTLHSKFIQNPSFTANLSKIDPNYRSEKSVQLPTNKILNKGLNNSRRELYTTINVDAE